MAGSDIVLYYVMIVQSLILNGTCLNIYIKFTSEINYYYVLMFLVKKYRALHVQYFVDKNVVERKSGPFKYRVAFFS